MEKNEEKSYWGIVGVLMTLRGLTELNGGAVWIIISEHLLPLSIVTVGAAIVPKTLLKVRF